jgi:hypothetical protein
VRKLGIAGLVVVMAASLGIATGGGVASAADNPLVGNYQCMYTYPGGGADPVYECTFDGTVNGVATSGSATGAVIYFQEINSCPIDHRAAWVEGIYTLGAGTGAFAGVTGRGVYSSIIGGPLPPVPGAFGASLGDASNLHCGPIVLPTNPPSPPMINVRSLPDGKVGEPYSAGLGVSNGTPPYRWRIINKIARLPRGLKISKSTGVIAGVPKKLTGTFSFVVEVRDSHRPKLRATREFSITVR